MRMEIFTRASGGMTRPMDEESLLMPLMQCMRGTGSMILSTGMVRNSGIMELHDTRDSSIKGRKMDMEDSIGKMVATMMDSSSRGNSKALGHITSRTSTKPIRVSFR